MLSSDSRSFRFSLPEKRLIICGSLLNGVPVVEFRSSVPRSSVVVVVGTTTVREFAGGCDRGRALQIGGGVDRAHRGRSVVGGGWVTSGTRCPERTDEYLVRIFECVQVSA